MAMATPEPSVSKATPRVSVCIANFNGRAIIDGCLQSVLAQKVEFPVEILVHDDASTDGSAAYIREHYPQIRLIESPVNLGFCKANNRMADDAQGTYLLLLNNDAMLYADALQQLFAEAVRLEVPALLGLPQFDAASGELVDRGCMLDPFFNPVPNLDPGRQDVAMVIGACLWIPKNLWQQIGGFPDWFGSIAEDLYLCASSRLAGYPLRVLNCSGYRHWQGYSFGGNRIREEGLSTTFRRRTLSERNKTFVLIVVSPIVLLILTLPLHLLLLHVEGFLLSVMKRDARIWTSIYAPIIPALWRKRAQLWSLRQATQGRRRISLRDWLQVYVLVPYKIRMLCKHGLPKIG